MQKVSAGIKSNLLILDEPTDGFSKEQLFKIREILDELRCLQVIMVSHEKELESFADQVMKIEKKDGFSQIKAAWRPVLPLWVIVSSSIAQKILFHSKTEDTIQVKQLLSHRNMNLALTYRQLVNLESEKYHVRAPRTLEETNSSKSGSNI